MFTESLVSTCGGTENAITPKKKNNRSWLVHGLPYNDLLQ